MGLKIRIPSNAPSGCFLAAIIIWILWALFCAAVVGGLVYCAIHFIGKYW